MKKTLTPGGCLPLPRGYIHVYYHHFQISSRLKSLGQSKPNFMWSLFRKWEKSLYKWSRSLDQDGRHAHILSKPLKYFFFRTGSPMILKLGMQHQRLKIYKLYINDDPGLTLTYFTARSNWVAHTIEWGKLLQSYFMGKPAVKD